MTPSTFEAKAALRRVARAKIAELTPDEKRSRSLEAVSILTAQPPWKSARSILFYAPLQDEIDLMPAAQEAWAAGKSVALPRYNPSSSTYDVVWVKNFDEDLARGAFGIREPGPEGAPIALNQLDLVLVPGLAFDLLGGRLGRGKGFYDRLLEPISGMTCGVCFEEQIMEKIPTESHDIFLQHILTPTRWHPVPQNARCE